MHIASKIMSACSLSIRTERFEKQSVDPEKTPQITDAHFFAFFYIVMVIVDFTLLKFLLFFLQSTSSFLTRPHDIAL